MLSLMMSWICFVNNLKTSVPSINALKLKKNFYEWIFNEYKIIFLKKEQQKKNKQKTFIVFFD